VITHRPGYLALRATGRDADKAFAHEAGGHRWQRVPPNDKRGRVHTSTVTVAVLPEPTAHEVVLDERDLRFTTCRGSGAGGQHRNTRDSAVQLLHVPTGLQVRIESERSQHLNRELARAVLRARLQQRATGRARHRRDAERRAMVGSGMRADKRRTVAVQRGEVVDHLTGRRTSVKAYLRGALEGLWPGR